MRKSEGTNLEQALRFAAHAIRKGDVQEGRRALLWILDQDPTHVGALLWFAYITEDVRTKIEYYQRVLRMDPQNRTAQQGLAKYQDSTQQSLTRAPGRQEAAEAPTTSPGISGVVQDIEDPVKAKLDVSRRDLLDLSLLNKLLNCKTLKTKGVEVVDELPEEVYRILVTEGRSMTFLHIPEEAADEQGEQRSIPTFADEEVEDLGQPDEKENGVPARYTDDKLQTPYVSAVLQKRLLNSYYTARTYIEEQGINVLFLALGMLRWFETPSSDVERLAPLLLVPVELSRSNVKSRFRVRFTEDEIDENLSLRSKLETDFKIKLPVFPEEHEIEVGPYFESVSEAISSQPRWTVDDSAVALGFFSFGNFLMFNDLDSSNWPEGIKPEAHPILHGLLDEGFDRVEDALPDEVDVLGLPRIWLCTASCLHPLHGTCLLEE